MRSVKATVFGRKQRALHDALIIGEQIRDRRRRDTLAACLTAWHLQVSKLACGCVCVWRGGVTVLLAFVCSCHETEKCTW